MEIEFNTSIYKEAHGRKPNRFERGSWAFFPTRECRTEDAIFSPSMTYGDAKRWMRQNAKVGRGAGFIEIYVGS